MFEKNYSLDGLRTGPNILIEKIKNERESELVNETSKKINKIDRTKKKTIHLNLLP